MYTVDFHAHGVLTFYPSVPEFGALAISAVLRIIAGFFAGLSKCSILSGQQQLGGNVRGLVITGGNGPPAAVLRNWSRGAVRIVAADSGLERARAADVEPDLVVGDMDSLRDRGLLDRFPTERVRSFDQDKDDTDTEIALAILFSEGYDEVVLAGGGGGRLDHLVGILAIFDRERHPTVWLTDRDEVTAVDGHLERRGMRGRVVSFFPVGNETCRMTSTGLQWPLDGLEWRHGDVGISNRVVDDVLRVDMMSGRLIMVQSLEESR